MIKLTLEDSHWMAFLITNSNHEPITGISLSYIFFFLGGGLKILSNFAASLLPPSKQPYWLVFFFRLPHLQPPFVSTPAVLKGALSGSDNS